MGATPNGKNQICKDSDLPVHLRSLIRVFADHMCCKANSFLMESHRPCQIYKGAANNLTLYSHRVGMYGIWVFIKHEKLLDFLAADLKCLYLNLLKA